MAQIVPVSDLRNYKKVLDRVEEEAPVNLTVEGRGRYAIQDIAEAAGLKQTKAMHRLQWELQEGRSSGEREGYLAAEEIRARLKEL